MERVLSKDAFNVSPSRRDFAAAKGSGNFDHLQEQFVTTFSSWSEICYSFDVRVLYCRTIGMAMGCVLWLYSEVIMILC